MYFIQSTLYNLLLMYRKQRFIYMLFAVSLILQYPNLLVEFIHYLYNLCSIVMAIKNKLLAFLQSFDREMNFVKEESIGTHHGWLLLNWIHLGVIHPFKKTRKASPRSQVPGERCPFGIEINIPSEFREILWGIGHVRSPSARLITSQATRVFMYT